MPRLRNVETGSVVNVDDKTAETLGPVYEPVEQSKRAPAKRAASKKSED